MSYTQEEAWGGRSQEPPLSDPGQLSLSNPVFSKVFLRQSSRTAPLGTAFPTSGCPGQRPTACLLSIPTAPPSMLLPVPVLSWPSPGPFPKIFTGQLITALPTSTTHDSARCVHLQPSLLVQRVQPNRSPSPLWPHPSLEPTKTLPDTGAKCLMSTGPQLTTGSCAQSELTSYSM